VKSQAYTISEQIAMDPSFRTIQTLELDDLGAMLNQRPDQSPNRSKSKSKPRKSRNPKKDHKIFEPAFCTTKNDRFVLNDINFGNDKKSYGYLGDKKRKTDNFTKKQNIGRPEVHRNDGQPLAKDENRRTKEKTQALMRYFENKDKRHKDTVIPAIMLNYEIYNDAQRNLPAKSQQAVSEKSTNPVIGSNKNCESDILLVKNSEISSKSSRAPTKDFEILEKKNFQSRDKVSSRRNEVIQIFDVDLETERGFCENILIPYQEPSTSLSQRSQPSNPTIDQSKLSSTNGPSGTIDVQGRSEDSISVAGNERAFCKNLSIPYLQPSVSDSEMGQLSNAIVDQYKLSSTNGPSGTIDVESRSEHSFLVLENSEFGAPEEEEIKI
jgi:hypothetical protein